MVVRHDQPYAGTRGVDRLWKHPLDCFQKHALDALDAGHSALVTAHTGAGKTVIAEYAIARAAERGHRVIYTSPIKSLSNQKYHELTKKFPDVSVGILTGDVKFNPDAQCVIMTTEILRNTLFAAQTTDGPAAFDIGGPRPIETIVYDEVHYINDPDRGTVWEEAIMMTPPGVKLAMLSATLHDPHVFAAWVEEVAKTTVHLCGTTNRPVPLSHHMLLHHPAAALAPKRTSHDAPETATTTTCAAVVRKHDQPFASSACDGIISTCAALAHAPPKYQMSAGWHLAAAVRELQYRDQLPAIAFVFARVKTEALAAAVRANLSPDPQAAAAAFASAVHRLPNWRGAHGRRRVPAPRGPGAQRHRLPPLRHHTRPQGSSRVCLRRRAHQAARLHRDLRHRGKHASPRGAVHRRRETHGTQRAPALHPRVHADGRARRPQGARHHRKRVYHPRDVPRTPHAQRHTTPHRWRGTRHGVQVQTAPHPRPQTDARRHRRSSLRTTDYDG